MIKTNKVYNENCLDTMKRIPDNSIDSIVTDPPYGLSKEPDIVEVLTKWMNDEPYEHGSSGFMQKIWDSFVPGPEYWKECYRILKPGGHLVTFGGTRTFDLISIALRISGFERRDTLMWVFGSGFPKSHNISKAIDKMYGLERRVVGESNSGPLGGKKSGRIAGTGVFRGDNWISAEVNILTAPESTDAITWDGWGTALKPAYEPILLCRKSLEKGLTIAENVMKWGTGGINIDDCRIEGEPPHHDYGRTSGNKSFVGKSNIPYNTLDMGRFPATIIHDGSDEVLSKFPDSKGQQGDLKGHNKEIKSPNGIYGKQPPRYDAIKREDISTSAARFFYCAKTTKTDRNEGVDENNTHPTVKPTSLMVWLCRLITPKGGIIYDPFAGSGSTGKASILEGFEFIGSELDESNVKVSNERIQYALENIDKLQHYTTKVDDILPKITENPYF